MLILDYLFFVATLILLIYQVFDILLEILYLTFMLLNLYNYLIFINYYLGF